MSFDRGYWDRPVTVPIGMQYSLLDPAGDRSLPNCHAHAPPPVLKGDKQLSILTDALGLCYVEPEGPYRAELMESFLSTIPGIRVESFKFDLPVKVVHIGNLREKGRVKPKRGLVSMNPEEIWVRIKSLQLANSSRGGNGKEESCFPCPCLERSLIRWFIRPLCQRGEYYTQLPSRDYLLYRGSKAKSPFKKVLD